MQSDRQQTALAAERQHGVDAIRSTEGGPLAVLRRASASLRSVGEVFEKPARLLRGGRFPRPPFYLVTLVLFVVIPSLLVQFHLIFLASDQYAAEARFAVRSGREDSRQGLAAISSMSQGGGGLASTSLVGQDAHVIVSYIRSRAIIDDLRSKIDLAAIFGRPEADWWARLPQGRPIENMTDYWRGMVTADVDGPSGIVTLTVRAFRPQDALDLAGAVLVASEELANTISDRSRRDTLARSEAEVKRTEAMVRKALADMREFRESVGFIDPVAAANATAKLIATAMVEKIKLENEIFVANRLMSQDAPTLASANLRLQSVNEQITRLKATLTGKDASDSIISKSLVTFEEIELRRLFAEKLYSLAQDDLERARVAASQKNVYVNVFVPPRLPEDARYPERLHLSVIIPVTLLILWGILVLTVAGIEDHRI